MKRIPWCVVLVVLFSTLALAQLERIVIPAGTPEDQALQAIAKEDEGPKKLAMYQDFLQKFSSNPAAVAYGNWQVSQYYQTAGDLPKALEFGDKALAGYPHNFDILVSQATIAQSMKDDAKIMEYAEKGGLAYEGIGKQPKAEGESDQDFGNRVASDKDSVKTAHDFLEGVGFNAIADERDAKKRCRTWSVSAQPSRLRSIRNRFRNTSCTLWDRDSSTIPPAW